MNTVKYAVFLIGVGASIIIFVNSTYASKELVISIVDRLEEIMHHTENNQKLVIKRIDRLEQRMYDARTTECE